MKALIATVLMLFGMNYSAHAGEAQVLQTVFDYLECKPSNVSGSEWSVYRSFVKIDTNEVLRSIQVSEPFRSKQRCLENLSSMQ